MELTNYSQKDQRWANKRLGNSTYTMATDGCVTTICARIASNVLKRDVTPGELCSWLSLFGGYLNGLIIWAKLEQFCGKKVKYLGKSVAFRPFARYILRAVIIGRYYHWVGVKADGMCFDPLDRTIKPINQKHWRITNDYRYLR